MSNTILWYSFKYAFSSSFIKLTSIASKSIGAIVIGLASIVIGEVISGGKGNFALRLSCIVCGSVIYRLIVAIVLQMGMNTDDLKLLTAILVGVALTVPVMISKRKQLANYKKLTKEGDNKSC